MELSPRARLARLEAAADETAERCPECVRSVVAAYEAAGLPAPDTTRPLLLYPMNLTGEAPAEVGPCPKCGAVPLELRPMTFDGNVNLSDHEPPAGPAKE